MASFSDTLTQKHGGIPTWGWFGLGIGALVVIMFMRARSAKAAAGSQDSGGAAPADVGSAQAAQTLAQGAYPMAYMGGDIYNNVLSQPTASATVTPAPTAPQPQPTSDPNVYMIPYKVKAGDTWASIGQAFGISAQHVFNSQNATEQKPGINGKPGSGDVLLVPWNIRLGAGKLPPGGFTLPAPTS